jgi:hypothetical protein
MNYLLRLTPSGIQIRGMVHPDSLRHPLFRRRWFTDKVIITCVRWYLRFKLSYRDLAELARTPEAADIRLRLKTEIRKRVSRAAPLIPLDASR